jgi:cellulose synthase/poly-beta-1,6-N-acetylglucosamine synthase-like glycosyltransferase
MQERYSDEAFWSCKRQECGVEFEVIVHHDHCLTGQGTGPANARNEAAKKAKGNWLLFNDSDNKLPSNFLDTLWKARLRSDNRCIVGCPVQFVSGRDLARLANQVPGIYTMDSFVDSVDISISSLFPASALREVGGFDESFTPAEDVEFWVRLLKRGYQYVHTWETCLLKTNDGLGLTLRTPKPVRDKKFQMINEKHGLRLKPWEVV